MKIYLRHVLKGFLGLLTLCLVGAVTIFVVVDFVGNSKVWLTRTPKDVYIYYLNFLPHIAYLVFPIAVLLAAVFSIGNLSRHLELVALRSAGIPVHRILAPLIAVGIFGSALMLWFQNSVMPDANHRRYEINEPKGENDEGGGDPAERFNYVYTASDGTVLFFDFYSGHRKTGQGVTILKQPKHGRLSERIDAKTMFYDTTWKLREGTRRDFAADGLKAVTFKEMAFPDLKDQPKDLLDDRVYPEEMGLKEIDRRIAILKRSGESARALETQRYFRWSSSLVCLVMALLGGALAVNTIKTGLARNFGVALGLTFLYYVALRLGLVMGENGSMAPLAAAWFGNLLFAPLGLFLLWRAARV